MLNIFDTISAFRYWKVDPRAYNFLANKGLISTGYDPTLDAYITRLHLGRKISLVLEELNFKPVKVKKEVASTTVPFFPPQRPKVYLRKKFEVWLPDGTTRRYVNAENLAADLAKLRSNPILKKAKETRIERSKATNALLKEKKQELPESDAMKTGRYRRMTRRTGSGLSLSGCDPADFAVMIKNLKTGKTIVRQAMSFDLGNRFATLH